MVQNTIEKTKRSFYIARGVIGEERGREGEEEGRGGEGKLQRVLLASGYHVTQFHTGVCVLRLLRGVWG